MNYQTLLLEQQDIALLVTLNRPHCRNAMSLQMVQELMQVFDAADQNPAIRAIVLRGADGHFCAGGDIKDMAGAHQLAASDAPDHNPFYDLNRAFGHMLSRVDNARQVVITLLEGAVLGGGFGLACVSDVAIAHQQAQFGLPETGLGVVPAQIAPFTVARIGLTQARRLALLGERFDGATAVSLGIAHYLAADSAVLSATLDQVLAKVKRAAPHANQITKALLHQVGKQDMEQLLDAAAQHFADAVSSAEGAEGTRAFVEKRLPDWAR